eukprot:Em0022g645a
MQRKLKAVSQHRHFNSRMELYKWEAHASDDECKGRIVSKPQVQCKLSHFLTFASSTSISSSSINIMLTTNKFKRPISKASSKTLCRYRKKVQKVRHVLTSDDPTILLREEIRSLSKNEKNSLLKDAGITLDISPEQGLAIKADLTLPWNKIRMIRRWFKGSGICLASERKQRQLAATLVGDNLDAPFTFLTASKNEEVRGAPHAFIPRLQDSVFGLLEDNASHKKFLDSLVMQLLSNNRQGAPVQTAYTASSRKRSIESVEKEAEDQEVECSSETHVLPLSQYIAEGIGGHQHDHLPLTQPPRGLAAPYGHHQRIQLPEGLEAHNVQQLQRVTTAAPDVTIAGGLYDLPLVYSKEEDNGPVGQPQEDTVLHLVSTVVNSTAIQCTQREHRILEVEVVVQTHVRAVFGSSYFAPKLNDSKYNWQANNNNNNKTKKNN